MKTPMTLLILLIFSSLLSAQKMSDGPYSVTLSEQTQRAFDHKSGSQTIRFKQNSGKYTLYKKGTEIAAGSFVMQTVDDEDPELNFNTGQFTLGNDLVYDRTKKTFHYEGNNYKPKKTNTMENIILSGILIVAKVEKFED